MSVRTIRSAPAALVTAWLLVPSGVARADVVMPLEHPCRPPQVRGVRSHREVCLEPAPASCPPGWRGVVGGQCVLDRCQDDTTCASGLRCTDVPLCFESRPDPSCVPQSRLTASDRSVLGAPLPMCPPGPSTYEEATHPCSDTTACAGSCKPDRLCLGPGQTPALVQPPPTTSPPHGGCAGCSVGRASGSEAAVAIGLLVSGLAALRGRKRGG